MTLGTAYVQCCKNGYKRDTQRNMRYHPGKSWWTQWNIQLEEKTQDLRQSLQQREVAKQLLNEPLHLPHCTVSLFTRLYNMYYAFAVESTAIVLYICVVHVMKKLT